MIEKKNINGLTEAEFLKKYKPGDYDRPSITVDILLYTLDEIIISKRKNPEKELKLLLIKRNDHPFIDTWAIPGGFVGISENLIDAAYRELKEETNLSEDIYLEQLYTFGNPNRDPRMRIISTAYMALTPKENILRTKAGDDARDAKWFSISLEKINDNNSILRLVNKEDNILIEYSCESINGESRYLHLKGEQLAFDHMEAIELSINRLRGKIFYTNIAFSLLEKEFTLTELQKVYETILGERLDKGNFRKKISNLVEKTDETNKNENIAYRPSKLYRLKK